MKLSLFSVSYTGYWDQQKLELPVFTAKASKNLEDYASQYVWWMDAGKRPLIWIRYRHAD